MPPVVKIILKSTLNIDHVHGFYTQILYKLKDKFWDMFLIWLIFGIADEEEWVILYHLDLPVLECAQCNVKKMHSIPQIYNIGAILDTYSWYI